MLRDKASLMDILESARIAVEHVGSKRMEEFVADIQCQDAVIRRLEMIGEASRRISHETREAYSELPWTAMIQMRNLLIHQYDGIDIQIVYETAVSDLPSLIESIEKIV
jgi:uncharacterized protein with HEPN domain